MTNPGSTQLTYTDFHLDLRSAEQNTWIVRIPSPLGDCHENCVKLALPPNAVEEALASIAYTTGYLRRSNQRHSVDPLVNLGKTLFRGLMEHTELGHVYAVAKEQARWQQQGLRLRLQTSDPAIALLPWEFLFDPDAYQPDFIVLTAQTELVRQWGDRLHPAPVFELPVRVLLLTTGSGLDAQSEIDALLKLAPDPKLLTFEVMQTTSKRELLTTLRQQPFHLLHLLGVGVPPNAGPQPGLLLLDQTRQENPTRWTKPGAMELVSTQELNDALQHQAQLGVVVISGCHTETVARDLTATAPATLGSRGTMTSQGRVTFMTALYQALLAGKSLDLAVAAGQLAIDRQTPGSREWGLPTLYVQTAQCPALPLPQVAPASLANAESLSTLPLLTPEQQTRQTQLAIEQINLAQLQQLQTMFGDLTPAYLVAEMATVQAKIDQMTASLPALNFLVR